MSDYQLGTIVDGGLERALTILVTNSKLWNLLRIYEWINEKRASNYLGMYF